MSGIDDDLLQRYYDGELSPVEERSVRARVDADPQAQKKLKQLARLSEALRDMADEVAGDLDGDALFEGIEQGLGGTGSGAPARFEVIRNEWVDHKKKAWVPLAVASAVAAAAVVTVLGPARDAGEPDSHLAEQTPERPTEAPGMPPDPGAQPEAGTIEILAAQGSHVEDVDFGDNAGTVFEIETRGISAAVVWIADDEGEEETP